MAIKPNNRYPTQTDAPSAAYPWGSARNVTTPGDGTGTPWEEAIINDWFGFFQELLDKSGITPSGSPDEVDTSQYYNAIRQTAGFPGLIVPMALNADPASFGLRILKLDGSPILRTNYPDLDAAVYCGDSNNTTAESFFRADASGVVRGPTQPYLWLADLRGLFIRGLDVTGTYDENGAGRIVGSRQDPSVRRHQHLIGSSTAPTFFQALGNSVGTGAANSVSGIAPEGNCDQVARKDKITDNSGSDADVTDWDNRPFNIALNYGIWY